MGYAVFPSEDVTAKARIRHAAFELIAEEGSRGATIRGIAARSGVSPGLVLHHFGSKQGVVASVSDWVLELLEGATADIPDAQDPASAHVARLAGFNQLVVDVPLLPAYLRRIMADGTPEGMDWFRSSVERTVADLRRREGSGVARPSKDRRAVATALVILGMAPVLLQPLIEHALEVDFDDGAARTRWHRATSEILTAALYPAQPGAPAPRAKR